ncbi:MAG: site-2 protease family protein [Planctomycetota bacterium]
MTQQATSPDQMTLPSDLVSAVRGVENRGRGWATKLAIMVGSLAVFIGLGTAVWDVRLVGMLALVLLWHETGHFLAMKWFGYRNVQMFFIPMMGAAVSGRHRHLSASKKALVFMAGPLPGLLTALVLFQLGLKTGATGWMQLGGLMMVLNTLNLLPLLPLDGGWILQLTILRRSPSLEIMIRLLTIVVVIAASLWTRDFVLWFVAIPLAIALPMSYRSAMLIHSIITKGVDIPPNEPLSATVIDRIDEAISGTDLSTLTPRQRAPWIIHVYENAVVPVPGRIESLLIWLLYLSAWSVAIGGGTLMFRQLDAARDDRSDPRWSPTEWVRVSIDLDKGRVLGFQTIIGDDPIGSSELAVLTCVDRASVPTLLGNLDRQWLRRFSHAQYGPVWLASVPTIGRELLKQDSDWSSTEAAWLAAAQPVDADSTWLAPISRSIASAHEDKSKLRIVSGIHAESIELHCFALSPEHAASLATEAFQSTVPIVDPLPIPVWSPIDPPSASQILCRDVLQQCMDGIDAQRTPKWHQRIVQASRDHLGGASDELEHQRELAAIQTEFIDSIIDRLAEPASKVAACYRRYQVDLNAYLLQRAAARMEETGSPMTSIETEATPGFPTLKPYLASCTGSLALADLTQPSHHFACHVSGSAEQSSPMLKLHVHRANDIAAALPALILWLADQGCSGFSLVFVAPID